MRAKKELLELLGHLEREVRRAVRLATVDDLARLEDVLNGIGAGAATALELVLIIGRLAEEEDKLLGELHLASASSAEEDWRGE